MSYDIDIKEVRRNCYRQSKVRGEFMLQMRVPGGVIEAKYLSFFQHIAETWGNGEFHFGVRQMVAIPGIKYENIDAVNKYIKSFIEDIEVKLCGVDMDVNDNGYPTIGARNTMACIGNRHCIKANIDTTDLARKIEKFIFPSDYHIKINIAGCPNDCAKAHVSDIGIIGVTKTEYDYERCIGCKKCVEACAHHATRVLSVEKGKIVKDICCCVGCGECVLVCPTGAWTRNPKKFYRVLIGGRTGKQTPRMGKIFLNWVTEDVVLGVFKNWQAFSAYVMNNKPEYLHGGHLIDRAGYNKFKEMILKDVKLNPEAMVAQRVLWTETEYRSNFNVKPVTQD
ncbi:MAG: anaerobic sulfite reductase subunit [Thermoanaerobacteraceae bacterium]|jgi:anaerobic sulfite reductase subunit C|uniref:Sulfite reductase subunit C n=1 Tax=Biomaibacter acetigenes TaxID=2316383 RepID=A0A3G2R303_9FIRM|nr:sulfite reductase subunit C [Biomaibacter acetigenes]AYO29695.1 sulfite reductase subunit C [Biomaibacter acetigenes]MDK2879615.1 anaerobic sulfite reductase subunit [Thermoanaerobacteraceae bacterium]MDN5311930.1 anaerobic sulfite reductase subunit [Thermoanaerobacteraceae bacterium]